MKSVSKHGILTLIALVVSLPLVYWIMPNTGAGTTLLIVIVLLITNAVGGLLWRSRQEDVEPSRKTAPPLPRTKRRTTR